MPVSRYPDPPPDILPRIIPAGEVHLLSGSPGAGKTRWMAQLLAAMHRGEEFFGWKLRKPNFIGVITSDRSFKDHQLWFNAVGFRDIPRYSFVDDPTTTGLELLSKSNKLDMFVNCLHKLDQHIPSDAIIFVDPISLFFGGDLNDYTRVQAHAIGLAKISLTRGLTLFASTHTPKQKGDPKQQFSNWTSRALGSVGNSGFTGTQFNIDKVEERGDSYHILNYMSHHAAPGYFKMQVDSGTGLFLPYTNTVPKNLIISNECLGVLANITDIGPTSIDVLVEKLQISKTAVYKHLRKLIELELILKTEEGDYVKTMEGAGVAPYGGSGTPN